MLKMNFRSKAIKELVFAALILCFSICLAYLLVKSKPEPAKKEIVKFEPIVEILKLKKTKAKISIHSQGKIAAENELNLQSEVSGKIIFKSERLKKGGFVKASEILLEIDPLEYEFMLAQKQGALARAKLELDLEKARSLVARSEFDRRPDKNSVDSQAGELAQRIPYLKKAQADYDAALADVKHAQLTLEKTKIRAPIDALVASADLNQGEMVFPQTPVARLIGTEEFSLELSIPMVDLPYIEFASNQKEGSRVEIQPLSNEDFAQKKIGHITRILPETGPLGHMAQVVVSINNPMGSNDQFQPYSAFLPGAMVRAKISGKNIHDVFAIPRSALHIGDSIFVVDNQRQIEKRPLKIIRREKDVVYVRNGLKENEMIVTTKMMAIKEGQVVRFASNSQ